MIYISINVYNNNNRFYVLVYIITTINYIISYK
jgi:hypothetical protein